MDHVTSRKQKSHSSAQGLDGKDFANAGAPKTAYIMEEQIGFLLRLANQRHTALFASMMTADLTPTQFAAIWKLREVGVCSQNLLGRLTAMDAPTIKGVVDRLKSKGLLETTADPKDKRRHSIMLSARGQTLVDRAVSIGKRITEATLEPLSPRDRGTLLRLLQLIS